MEISDNKSISTHKMNNNTIKKFVTTLEDICNKISIGEIESYTSEPITNFERYLTYKYVETNTDFITQTIDVEGTKGKKIIIIKKKDLTEFVMTDVKLNKEKIDFFIKYSKLPIPTNSQEHIEYYINLLKPYYKTEQYMDFLSDIEKYGFDGIKLDCVRLKNEIIQLFKSNEKFEQFVNTKSEPIYPNGWISKSNIYNQSNLSTQLLSIDIKSANWTCIKKIYGFDDKETWENIVSKFTPSKFLQKSKYLREFIFGELGSKKLNKFIGEFIFQLDCEIKSNQEFSVNLTQVVCNMDEIVYKITNPTNFYFTNFMDIIMKKLDPNNQIYRVEQFVLKKINPYDYWIKKISCSNEIESKLIQFKQVPKHFICQIIKHLTGEKVNELDKKFMFENFVCTFDNELTFDK